MVQRREPVGTESGRGASERLAARGARCLQHFERTGFRHMEVPMLQPIEPFLELSGEDIRSRLFVTSNADGQELCLRPEFTIPAALDYLKSGGAGRRADLAMLGPVFRHRPGESGEFIQLGVESLGRADREAADADILAQVLDALKSEVSGEKLAIRIGDLNLFSALIDKLSLSQAWARRLTLALGEGRILSALDPTQIKENKGEARGLARYSGVLDALKGADPSEARAFVKDILAMAGISATGGRSPDDIAGRFLDRAREDVQSLGSEQAEIIRRFLAISGDPDRVANAVRSLADEAALDMRAEIDRFELRTGFLEARGIMPADMVASAGFARNLEYYSGFVFDIRLSAADARPVAGGGRYDRLFTRLGADVPAIGAAIWIERFENPERAS